MHRARAASFLATVFLAALCVSASALVACDYGGYAPSDRDNCVPCRERLPARQCPREDCCRYLSDDPYQTTLPEARSRYDACVAQERYTEADL